MIGRNIYLYEKIWIVVCILRNGFIIVVGKWQICTTVIYVSIYLCASCFVRGACIKSNSFMCCCRLSFQSDMRNIMCIYSRRLLIPILHHTHYLWMSSDISSIYKFKNGGEKRQDPGLHNMVIHSSGLAKM